MGQWPESKETSAWRWEVGKSSSQLKDQNTLSTLVILGFSYSLVQLISFHSYSTISILESQLLIQTSPSPCSSACCLCFVYKVTATRQTQLFLLLTFTLSGDIQQIHLTSVFWLLCLLCKNWRLIWSDILWLLVFLHLWFTFIIPLIVLPIICEWETVAAASLYIIQSLVFVLTEWLNGRLQLKQLSFSKLHDA